MSRAKIKLDGRTIGTWETEEGPIGLAAGMLGAMIEIDPNPCYAGWAGCAWSYSRGHTCKKPGGHAGLHVCDCGARAGKKADAHDRQSVPGRSDG